MLFSEISAVVQEGAWVWEKKQTLVMYVIRYTFLAWGLHISET